jgi:hypothetical protein
MKRIPEGLTLGPFTLDRGAELGLSERVLEGRRFRSPWSGVRTLREAPESLVDRCQALALVLPESAVFSHHTALHLGGWLTPHLGDGPARYTAREPGWFVPIHVAVPLHDVRPQRRGVVGHRSDLSSDEIWDINGLRVTSPWRTWCDLADSSSEVDLVILADALRRRFGNGAYGLETQLGKWGGCRGVRTLRRALSRSRDGVDSPMETRLRLIFADAGLPEPVVNRWVTRDDGSGIHCPDLSWPAWRVAADYDGRHHADRDSTDEVRRGHASDWRKRQDTSRGELLEEAGWILRVFTSYDVFRAPERATERMRAALRKAGADV